MRYGFLWFICLVCTFFLINLILLSFSFVCFLIFRLFICLFFNVFFFFFLVFSSNFWLNLPSFRLLLFKQLIMTNLFHVFVAFWFVFYVLLFLFVTRKKNHQVAFDSAWPLDDHKNHKRYTSNQLNTKI